MQIVIDSGYFDSSETHLIRALLGRGSEILFLRLKCRLAELPAGTLETLSPTEIEALAGWWGEPGRMFLAFEKSGIMRQLERNDANSEIASDFGTANEKEREARKEREEKDEREKQKERDIKKDSKEKEEKEEIETQQEKEKVSSPNLPFLGEKEHQNEPPKEPQKYTQEFLAFWAQYPRKTGKAAAFRSWRTHKAPLKECLKALEWQKKSDQWTKDGGQFIPHPATWLNQERWLDEPSRTERDGGKYAAWEEGRDEDTTI